MEVLTDENNNNANDIFFIKTEFPQLILTYLSEKKLIHCGNSENFGVKIIVHIGQRPEEDNRYSTLCGCMLYETDNTSEFEATIAYHKHVNGDFSNYEGSISSLEDNIYHDQSLEDILRNIAMFVADSIQYYLSFIEKIDIRLNIKTKIDICKCDYVKNRTRLYITW